MKAVPKDEIINIKYREKMAERKALLLFVRNEYGKTVEDLELLKAELIKALRGESVFSEKLLGTMVSEAEKKCAVLLKQVDEAQVSYNEGQEMLASLKARYDDIISWAEMYDTASLETKKMIVNSLIARVEVSRGYKVHVEFNVDFQQFCQEMETDRIEIVA